MLRSHVVKNLCTARTLVRLAAAASLMAGATAFAIDVSKPEDAHVATLRWYISLAYPNALQPAEHPEESTGSIYLASEHFTFFANTADVLSDTQRSTPTHYSWFRTGPWLPWMKMGQTPGYLIYSGHGRKYGSFDDLPAQVREYTLKHFPAFATAPDGFYQPNETSWTYYAKLKRAGKLPTDCK
jgi:hypothetical protein